MRWVRQIGGEAVQGDVRGYHAVLPVAGRERCRDGDADQTEGPEYLGIRDRGGAGGDSLGVPGPLARIVAALCGHLAEAVLAGVQEHVAIEHRRAARRLHQPVGELRVPGGGGLPWIAHLRIVDAARLTERPVREPDIDVEDGVAVLKDTEQVGQRAIVREDARVLAAEFGGGGDERAEGGKAALDVADGLAAEAFEQVRRVVAGDAIARDIVDPHDPEQDRDGHRHEHHEHRRP